MCRLGVNIDHVATIRQARGGQEPDPVWASALAELAGADVITIHLREDRRHIQDRDLRVLRETVRTRLNLEMAIVPEIITLAIETRPDFITLVPERRQELTTEGGLDVVRHREAIAAAVAQLKAGGLPVSLFIDPRPEQVNASADVGADAIELHTGSYGEARSATEASVQLELLRSASARALELGLGLHAGHGLNYQNVGDVARIRGMSELNIGHSIVSRAVMVGMERAVKEMKSAIDLALLKGRASLE